MLKPRASLRYFGSQKMKKNQAPSVRNFAMSSVQTEGMRNRLNQLTRSAGRIVLATLALSLAGETGGAYRKNHAAAQTTPIAPVTIKTMRQPLANTIVAISGGAITAPRAEPVLNMPTASERSRAGNHSATTFADAGNPPPSPSPRRKRAVPSPAID